MSAHSQFEGMSQREIAGMPMVGEATGLQLAAVLGGRPNLERTLEVARVQEKYVRAVLDRCPSWRRRKKRQLASALDHAEAVSRILLTAVHHHKAAKRPNRKEGPPCPQR